MRNRLIAICALLALAAIRSESATTPNYVYQYNYVGPNFVGNAGVVTVSLTFSALLKPSTSYSGLPASTTSARINVTFANPLGNFSLPVQSFAVSTDAAGNIAAWSIAADANNLNRGYPQVGTDRAIQSVNTLSTAVPLPGQIKTHAASDAASVTNYFASCAGMKGCLLASNGQPYLSLFAGAVTTGGGKWTVSRMPASGGGSGGSSGGGRLAPL